MTLPLKRIVVCSHCNQQIQPDGRVEKLKLPEFRTDHSEECICGACVFRRWDARRRSIEGASKGGAANRGAR